MTYVIRDSDTIHILYEGVQQKIFEIDGKALHPLYPVDNLVGYIKEVEKKFKKNKHKSLVDVLYEVDSSCAECMLVAEADNVAKLHYSQKFKEEIKLFSSTCQIRNLTTPFQISKTFNGKTNIIYPSETEIHLPPKNYKDFWEKFSKKANEKNNKTYEIMRRFTDIFGNAFTSTSIMYILDASPCRVPSFKKFEEFCDKMLTDLEFKNETSEYYKSLFSSGKQEEKSTRGIPPCVDYIHEIFDEFQHIGDIWEYYRCFLKEGPIKAIKRTKPDDVRFANLFFCFVSSPVWLYYSWPLIKKGAEFATHIL